MAHILPSYSTVVIVGGGPSGLALSIALRRRGIECVVLEKGGIGESWARMPQHLKLVSPWKCNWITAESRNRFPRHAELTRVEFLDYLRDTAKTAAVPIFSGYEVLSVESEDSGFRVTTSQGVISAAMLVNAAGYFSNPRFPNIPGADATSIPQQHYSEHINAESTLAHGKRSANGEAPLVLIVGSRLSAGQLALELFDAGARVAISHRRPIQFGVNDLLWPLVYRAFAPMEALRLALPGAAPQRIEVPMNGGRIRKLIQSGKVRTFPEVARFGPTTAEFANGESVEPSMVIYATGFAPALKHLALLDPAIDPETNEPVTKGMESENVPKLFFLGIDMLSNFQSRFLRGIRRDAICLADILASRLARTPKARMPACVA